MIDNLMQFVQDRLTKKNDRGASAVEYGLLIAGIAALIVVAVFALGPVVRDAFEKTCDVIGSNATPSTDCDA